MGRCVNQQVHEQVPERVHEQVREVSVSCLRAESAASRQAGCLFGPGQPWDQLFGRGRALGWGPAGPGPKRGEGPLVGHAAAS